MAGGLEIQLPLESRRKLTAECTAHEKGAFGALFSGSQAVPDFPEGTVFSQ